MQQSIATQGKTHNLLSVVNKCVREEYSVASWKINVCMVQRNIKIHFVVISLKEIVFHSSPQRCFSLWGGREKQWRERVFYYRKNPLFI